MTWRLKQDIPWSYCSRGYAYLEKLQARVASSVAVEIMVGAGLGGHLAMTDGDNTGLDCAHHSLQARTYETDSLH